MVYNATLTIARTVAEVRTVVASWRAQGYTVGLVPTMGALHRGHLALIDRARQQNDRVLATIFVNPLQFGPAEDFAAYPRDDARDFAVLNAAHCDAVFAPAVSEMFGPGAAGQLEAAPLRVSVPQLAGVLCGVSRAGHFDGVATIVLKLLLIAQADRAYFGEKDFQQFLIVKRVVQELCVPVRIEGVPIVREADGLALSSRNAYLSVTQRAIAPSLQRVLRSACNELASASVSADDVLARAREDIATAGFDRVEYVTLAAGDTLESLSSARPEARLFGAAWLGTTRLIDNLAVYCGD